MTDFYERPFQPLVGCNIRKRLFYNITIATALAIHGDIDYTLRNYEPRINVNSIIVTPYPDRNIYTIDIQYTIIKTGYNDTLIYSLERIR